MATKQEIRERAAQDLGILELNQALETEHADRIDASYNEVYEELKEDGIAIWASTDEVPTRLVPYISNLVAFHCLETYSVSQDRYNRIIAKLDNSNKQIRKLTQNHHESTEEPRDF